jgi:hypothetical protein
LALFDDLLSIYRCHRTSNRSRILLNYCDSCRGVGNGLGCGLSDSDSVMNENCSVDSAVDSDSRACIERTAFMSVRSTRTSHHLLCSVSDG